jgi:hypothetical protein
MALTGDLETMPVRELLGWLATRRATGQLTLSRGMVVRRFHLRKGQVLMASSSEADGLLGQLLLSEGLVTAQQLEGVLGRRARSRARLGKALEQAGLVDAGVLGRVLSDKVERLLRDSLVWGEGAFHFQVGAQPRRQAAVATAVDLAALLARAADGKRPAPAAEAEVAVTDADVIEARPLGAERRRAARWRERLGLPLAVSEDRDGAEDAVGEEDAATPPSLAAGDDDETPPAAA